MHRTNCSADWSVTLVPRGLPLKAFAERLRGTVAARGEGFDTVAQALDAALEQANGGDRVVVFGSFYTAAAALGRL